MADFDVNNCLPNELRIKSVESHLFRIGLCFENINKNSDTKRIFLNKPIVVFLSLILFSVKMIVNYCFNNGITKLSIVLGDIGNFYGISFEMTFSFILFTILCIGSQSIFYYNYRNGIKPTFLRVFEMMAGLVSPKSIGLTDKKVILDLLKKTDILFKLTKINNNIVSNIFCMVISIIPYIINCSPIETIVFGIPNTIFLMIFSYHSYNIFVYLMIHFYILCYYLINKIKSKNNLIMKANNNSKLFKLFKLLDNLYREIDEYNRQFWSKFLLIFWLTFGTLFVFVVFTILFKNLPIFVKLFFTYFSILYLSIFLFIIFKASAVNYEVNKTYQLFNNLMAYQSKPLNRRKLKLMTNIKIKVFTEF